jgi:glycosyltransferase involved in cell wall biosynthesis
MSKGTVLYIGGFELPDKNAAAHRVLSNGKIFRELGYNNVFIGVDKSLNFDSDILSTKTDVQGFDCYLVPYPNSIDEWLKYLTSIDFMSTMAKKYCDIKVVVAYNYPSVALMNLKRYCAKKQIKIIADCTEWYSTKGANIIYKIIKGLDSFFRMRVIQKQLDGLIVISKYLENYYRNCKNVVRIPPLVDIHEDKWKISKETLEVNNKWKIVYTGSPGKYKDKINYIIDALYRLREYENYQMDVVGITKHQFLEIYPDYIEKIKILDNRINFVGRVPHEATINILKNADYSIFIRDRSRLTMAGFPTKFVESVTCSTQVITNDSSDISEYFADNTFGYLLPDSSVDNLYNVLLRIFQKEKHCDVKKFHLDNNETFYYRNYTNLIKDILTSI